ncbi:hypothetical protein C8R47DRAFT_1077788 [Mycena vitilis]|nr:hypothetical protein C8R47DRAFT_1077788 [Mycena vitilis]
MYRVSAQRLTPHLDCSTSGRVLGQVTPIHEAPPQPDDWVQTSVDRTFGVEDDDFNSFLASLVFAQDTSMGQISSYDPTIFRFAGDDFNSLILTNAGLPFAAPFDESEIICGYSGAFPDTITTSSLAFAAPPFENQLPSLPPPPSDSPPVPSTPAEPRNETVQKTRRGVRKEVDEANIITSTRSRAPTFLDFYVLVESMMN